MQEVAPSITKASAQKILSDIEEKVTGIRRCFINGSYTMGDKTLTTDNLAELAKFTTAYYSWAVTLWGNLKSMYETAEQMRKLRESNAFVKVKKGSKISAKEAEAEAFAEVENYIHDEMDWRFLFNRANSCRLALESFMKSIDSLKYIRSKEWGAAE